MSTPVPPLVPTSAMPLATDSDAAFDAKAFPALASLNPFGVSLEAIAAATVDNADAALAAALAGDLPAITGQALKFLRVNAGETAAEFAALGDLAFDDAADRTQTQGTWNTGTDTTESLISAAKLAGAIAAASGSDWEVVETIATTSGTSITVPSSGNLADGYQYAVEFLEVEHNAGVNSKPYIDLYGETDTAFLGTPQAIGAPTINNGWYGVVQLPVHSRVAVNAHTMPAGRLADNSAGTGGNFSADVSGTIYSPFFFFATAQKVGRVRFSVEGFTASFDNGSVKLWRKAL